MGNVSGARPFSEIYGTQEESLQKQKSRYKNLARNFKKIFDSSPTHFFSAPGRTEISGNHTDHNHGQVLAAAVNLDAIAAVRENGGKLIRVYSEGYPEPFEVNRNELPAREAEKGTSTALIRGIAARFVQLGYKVDGFDALITSEVLPGSGLSSSAAIEVLLGTIFNHLFNDGEIGPEQIAAIGQFAENHYFGKPSGLMDQMASAVGGMMKIDFANPEKPAIKKIPLDLAKLGYRLLIVNTGGSHANLTPHYAAIPQEMKAVAGFFGKDVLREISRGDVLSHLFELRRSVGDRAVLRALHFFEENERVMRQMKALESGDFRLFLEEVRASGNSSWKWLQNVTTPDDPHEQGMALALALTENFIRDFGEGACRVHGGGFAGTIQAFLPAAAVSSYKKMAENVFGEGSVYDLSIRRVGATPVDVP